MVNAAAWKVVKLATHDETQTMQKSCRMKNSLCASLGGGWVVVRDGGPIRSDERSSGAIGSHTREDADEDEQGRGKNEGKW